MQRGTVRRALPLLLCGCVAASGAAPSPTRTEPAAKQLPPWFIDIVTRDTELLRALAESHEEESKLQAEQQEARQAYSQLDERIERCGSDVAGPCRERFELRLGLATRELEACRATRQIVVQRFEILRQAAELDASLADLRAQCEATKDLAIRNACEEMSGEGWARLQSSADAPGVNQEHLEAVENMCSLLARRLELIRELGGASRAPDAGSL